MRKLLFSAILTLALIGGAVAVLTVHPRPAMACTGDNCR
jgi:hypothetical protein